MGLEVDLRNPNEIGEVRADKYRAILASASGMSMHAKTKVDHIAQKAGLKTIWIQAKVALWPEAACVALEAINPPKAEETHTTTRPVAVPPPITPHRLVLVEPVMKPVAETVPMKNDDEEEYSSLYKEENERLVAENKELQAGSEEAWASRNAAVLSLTEAQRRIKELEGQVESMQKLKTAAAALAPLKQLLSLGAMTKEEVEQRLLALIDIG